MTSAEKRTCVEDGTVPARFDDALVRELFRVPLEQNPLERTSTRHWTSLAFEAFAKAQKEEIKDAVSALERASGGPSGRAKYGLDKAIAKRIGWASRRVDVCQVCRVWTYDVGKDIQRVSRRKF
jgi:hypothetical protein